MTILGKIIISLGILIFTGSTLAWISSSDWHWFAGGGTIFLASVLTAAVVSAETKPTSQSPFTREPKSVRIRSSQYDKREEEDTREYPIIEEPSWTPPPTPPPDEVDPFDRPAQR